MKTGKVKESAFSEQMFLIRRLSTPMIWFVIYKHKYWRGAL